MGKLTAAGQMLFLSVGPTEPRLSAVKCAPAEEAADDDEEGSKEGLMESLPPSISAPPPTAAAFVALLC
eukprot:CAMPEP_0195028490 /NCGR_PEP_ID=MMETSP0326_2-20130528/54591_1 /TAXON_ID=2866 ORGANISM="Crypthecodinium cohnii, Strain Seligo" /NCGR_SAMPLE_ID=MMETSP0326_2 /ASSEMBLY_ACC=CAM_ASM_000348 /LENGTH=68 /DNA_ID=CAMNT_0040051049 /DNA_START=348 /DNA_END=552 /DNA_ORIENTATION=-